MVTPSAKGWYKWMDVNLFWLNRQVCGGRRGLVLRCICEFIPLHLWESRAFDRLQGGMNFYIQVVRIDFVMFCLQVHLK